MALRQSEVLASLDAISLGGLQDISVDRIKRRLALGDLAAATNDTRGRDFILAMLRALSGLAANTAYAKAIEEADICVLRADIVNACAIATPDGPKIVIYTGLLKVLMFMLEYQELIGVIERGRERILPRAKLGEGRLESLGYQAFTLIGHFALWETKLPRPYANIGRSDRAGLWLEMSKIIWFIVCHELAHIKLGHISPAAELAEKSVYPALALDEGVNFLKLQEFQADEYIIQSLAGSVKGTFLTWALLPLQTFCSLERLLSDKKSTHPMAINRLNNLKEHAIAVGEEESARLVADILTRQIEAERAHISSKQNHYLHSSYEIALKGLQTLQHCAKYAGYWDQPGGFRNNPERAWGWDLLVDHFWSNDE